MQNRYLIMNILVYRTWFFSVCALMFLPVFVHSQAGSLSIEEDPKVGLLLMARKMANKQAESTYRIQIYSGTVNEAEAQKIAFSEAFPLWSCDMKFETPNYKIWVGNFSTRLEADRQLVTVKEAFPNAFILSPKKSQKL